MIMYTCGLMMLLSECGLCCHQFCSSQQPTQCNVPKLERLRRPSFTQSEWCPVSIQSSLSGRINQPLTSYGDSLPQWVEG